MHRELRVEKRNPIYDPEQFEEFCKTAGCQNLFLSLVKAQSPTQQSPETLTLTKIRTVATLYRLFFGLSQWCNFFQKDFGTYLQQNGSSQVAIKTARIIGDSVSSQVIGNSEEEVSAKHDELLDEIVQHAVDNECLLVPVTDDFHTCHSQRRPTSEQTSVNNPMCTIIIKKFPTIKAVILQEDANNPEGINIEKVSQFITSIQNMKIITQQTYTSSMPAWLKEQFFNPKIDDNG